MSLYRIDKTRWRLGRHMIETGFHRQLELGFYWEDGSGDGDEKMIHVSLGWWYLYWSRPCAKWTNRAYRYGFDLTSRFWQRWFGEYDSCSDNKFHVFFNWRDALCEKLFGRSVYVRSKGHSEAITVVMPEGGYTGTATLETAIWTRERWPLRKLRRSVWVDMDSGIPHAGKGENSWDCGDDALCGFGIEGTDIEAAIEHGRASVMDKRKRWGMASEMSPEVPA